MSLAYWQQVAQDAVQSGARVDEDGQLVEGPDVTFDVPDVMTAGALIWAVRWAQCGMPVLEPAHRLAASMMATTVSPDTLSSCVLPWPAFAIRLPPRLVWFDAVVGESSLSLAMVLAWSRGVSLYAANDARNLIATPVRPLSSLAEAPPVDATLNDGALALTDMDERALLLVGRLVIGCCMELGGFERKGPPPRHGTNGRRTGPPKTWTFKLSRATTFDARSAVSEFSRLGGSSPKVQSMIRGHWRRQPYGPGKAHRRWQQVEPYWRGPEDAPILSHPLKVGHG